MLSFLTEFPVNELTNLDAFNQCIQKWLLGSRYTLFTPSLLAELGRNDGWECKTALESISCVLDITNDIEAAATIYSKRDSDFEWITTIVFSGQPSSSWVSIRVECKPLHPIAMVPNAKKPVLVKTILNTLEGGVDGEFRVSEAPVIFTNSEYDLAASCILGGANTYLPIVYVSAPFRGQYSVEPNKLASRLFGMAHVVVEPNRDFSIKVMEIVQSRNVYGGVIALYWPEGAGRRTFFPRHNNISVDEFEENIFEEIRMSLINRRPLVRCTLAAVNELKARRLINSLKDAGSAEVQLYVDAFEEELTSKAAALENSEKEIARLKAEIRKYESQSEAINSIALDIGGERDFYGDEILSVVLDALTKAEANVTPDSRRQDLLKALIGANSCLAEGDAIRKKIKELLRDYRTMTPKVKQGLEETGFLISDDGRHYKIILQDDSRYTFSLSKSGSDYKGGLNAASDICNLFF